MKVPRFFLCCLAMMAASLWAKAQTSVPDCDEIKVEAKTVTPSNNSSDGSIDLILTKPFENYKVFVLNAGRDKNEKVELHSSKIDNLKAGFFDFLIIDKNRKGCIKQLTVVLK